MLIYLFDEKVRKKRNYHLHVAKIFPRYVITVDNDVIISSIILTVIGDLVCLIIVHKKNLIDIE